MKPFTSLYLDAVRFTAAVTVFIGHIASATDPHFTTPAFTRFFTGVTLCIDEAVVIFFVLSGFVIAHATQGRRQSASDYAVARLARIYSVALPALVLTLVLDSIGRVIAPALYRPFAPEQFVGALFFLNQLWYVDTGVGSNGPYWSLNYEVWYYVLFGLAMFLQGARRVLAILALLVVCGPQIAVYSLLWLLGVLLYRIANRTRIPAALGWLMFLVGPVIFGLTVAYGAPGEEYVLARLAWVLRDSNVTHDAFVALGFALHLLGATAIADQMKGRFDAVERPVRWLAGATFTIYLFHMPICRFLLAFLPAPPTAWAGPFLLGAGFLLLLAIAQVTERRKRVWQNFFRALLNRAERRVRTPALTDR